MTPNKRSFRNYFVNKRFQTKYLLLTILLLGTYTFIFTIILFLPSILTLFLDYPLDKKAEAARTFLTLHDTVWPTTGAVILIFGILSVFLSHKIAGPAYRLKHALTGLIGGNLDTRIHLRKWDDLQELAEQFNLFADNLSNYIQTLKAEYEQLSNHLDQLEKSGTAADRDIIRRLQEQKKVMAVSLERFTSQF